MREICKSHVNTCSFNGIRNSFFIAMVLSTTIANVCPWLAGHKLFATALCRIMQRKNELILCYEYKCKHLNTQHTTTIFPLSIFIVAVVLLLQLKIHRPTHILLSKYQKYIRSSRRLSPFTRSLFSNNVSKLFWLMRFA